MEPSSGSIEKMLWVFPKKKKETKDSIIFPEWHCHPVKMLQNKKTCSGKKIIKYFLSPKKLPKLTRNEKDPLPPSYRSFVLRHVK